MVLLQICGSWWCLRHTNRRSESGHCWPQIQHCQAAHLLRCGVETPSAVDPALEPKGNDQQHHHTMGHRIKQAVPAGTVDTRLPNCQTQGIPAATSRRFSDGGYAQQTLRPCHDSHTY